MQKDDDPRHQNRTGQISFNHKNFLSQFEHWLKHDLPNVSNHIKVTLSSIKKVHLKKLVDHI